MNLSANLSLSDLNPAKLAPLLARYKNTLVTLIIVALLGYTAYQISRITAVQPDQAYMTTQQGKVKTPTLKLNKATAAQLRGLRSPGDTAIPRAAGKHDPFSLN